MCTNVFAKKFKKEFGMPAYQWMLKQMCKKITHKALEPGVTIKELMFEVGIENQTHFNRFYRRQFNTTPKQLLAKCQGDITPNI